MAELKNTIVNGVLNVNGDAIASKIIKRGGTSSQILMADGSVVDKSSIQGTTYTGGTGISIGTNNVINHANSVTAVTTTGLYKIKYDAQGHITGTESFTLPTVPDVSGFVTGPSESTDNAIVRFNGIGGKSVQNSGITIDDNNVMWAKQINLQRDKGEGYGQLRFYANNYNTWINYMAPFTSNTPTGKKYGGYGEVTNWAIHSLVEDTSGCGWVWESCQNSGTPDPKMALSSVTGNLKLKGEITANGFEHSGLTAASGKTRDDYVLLAGGGTKAISDFQAAGNYLPKTTYEWNKEYAASSNGAVSLGRYNLYDTQLTFDITTTTSTTISGKLVIAAQNGNILKATVYGDASNTLAGYITIYQSAITGSRSWIEVFCNFPGWSKNKVHIYAVALNSATVTRQMTSVTFTDGVPSGVTSGDTKWTGTIVNDIDISGFVTGPSESTDNAVVRFDGATGKVIQNSGVTIDDNNKLKINANDTGGQSNVFQALSTSASENRTTWIGRSLMGSKTLTFLMGTYNNMAAVGAHSWTDANAGSGAAWAPMYFQPDGGATAAIYMGQNGTGWKANTGTLIVKGSGTANAGTVDVNGTFTATTIKKTGGADTHVLLAGGGTKAISDFASASGYLPLTGGTMTGAIILPENKMALKFRTHGSYETGIAYGTSGNEALTIAMQNPVTAFQIVYGTKPSDYGSSTWQSVTPLFQTKDGKVIINRKITQTSDTSSLKLLDVNGEMAATTIYENGTSLTNKYAAKDHNHDGTYLKAEVDTLQSVTNRGATTNKTITALSYSVNSAVTMEYDSTYKALKFVFA